MPVKPFFNFYKNKPEQTLVDNLIDEAINIFGFNGYYIPNTNKENRDFLYGDDPLKRFDEYYIVAAYLSNSVDPGMSNEFFSKFGLEIKNSVRIQLSRKEFKRQVPLENLHRPQEGDLFYIPFLSGNGELYEIKFVNDSTDFFTLGRKEPYYWELELELFKYSHEEISTGEEEIDFVNKTDAYSLEFTLTNGSGNYNINEFVYQGNSLSNPTAMAKVQDWDGANTTIRLSNISGTFSNTSQIIGGTSNTRYYITTPADPMDNVVQENPWDNNVIENEFDNFIDNSESNPFGIL